MSRLRWRTMLLMSTYPVVVTSPATTTRPVVSSVSTATRLCGSCSSMASRTESLIWSAILSGWPSVTDSEVKRRPVTAVLLLSDAGCGTRYPPSHGSGRRSRTWSVLEPRDDLVPDHVGQGGLRATGYVDGGSVGAEQHGLVVRAPEHGAAAHVVHDQQVAALAGQLGAGQVEDRAGLVAGLGREPDDDRAGPGAVVADLAEDVGVLRQLDRGRGAVVG